MELILQRTIVRLKKKWNIIKRLSYHAYRKHFVALEKTTKTIAESEFMYSGKKQNVKYIKSKIKSIKINNNTQF